MTIRRANGFTLIELIVTIAVLAILLSVAVPSFQDFFDRGRLRGATDAVVAMISTARGEAVKTGRNVTISFTGSASVWCIGANQAATPSPGVAYANSAGCDCTVANACSVDGVERVVKSADFNNVTLTALPSPNSFDIDGKQGALASLTTRQVTFISPASAYRLRLDVSPLGQSRTCVPSGQRAISGFPSC